MYFLHSSLSPRYFPSDMISLILTDLKTLSIFISPCSYLITSLKRLPDFPKTPPLKTVSYPASNTPQYVLLALPTIDVSLCSWYLLPLCTSGQSYAMILNSFSISVNLLSISLQSNGKNIVLYIFRASCISNLSSNKCSIEHITAVYKAQKLF